MEMDWRNNNNNNNNNTISNTNKEFGKGIVHVVDDTWIHVFSSLSGEIMNGHLECSCARRTAGHVDSTTTMDSKRTSSCRISRKMVEPTLPSRCMDSTLPIVVQRGLVVVLLLVKPWSKLYYWVTFYLLNV
jgi:hypothetical protein